MTKEEIQKNSEHWYNKYKELEKENAELKKINSETLTQLNLDNGELIIENEKLRKENAELKEQGDKWFVFETEAGNWGMDKATQYTVDRHNYFYGTKEECQKWGVEHKIKDYTGHKYCYDRLDNQLAKAKDLIEDMYDRIPASHSDYYKDIMERARQFLKEIEK